MRPVKRFTMLQETNPVCNEAILTTHGNLCLPPLPFFFLRIINSPSFSLTHGLQLLASTDILLYVLFLVDMYVHAIIVVNVLMNVLFVELQLRDVKDYILLNILYDDKSKLREEILQNYNITHLYILYKKDEFQKIEYQLY